VHTCVRIGCGAAVCRAQEEKNLLLQHVPHIIVVKMPKFTGIAMSNSAVREKPRFDKKDKKKKFKGGLPVSRRTAHQGDPDEPPRSKRAKMIEKEEEDNDYVGSNVSPLANIAKARAAAQKTDAALAAATAKSATFDSPPLTKTQGKSASKSVKFRMDEEVSMNVPPSARKAKALDSKPESSKVVSFVAESPGSKPRSDASIKVQMRDSTPARALKASKSDSGRKLEQRQPTPGRERVSGKSAAAARRQMSPSDDDGEDCDSDSAGSNDDTLDITSSGDRNKLASKGGSSSSRDDEDGDEVRELDFDDEEEDFEQGASGDESDSDVDDGGDDDDDSDSEMSRSSAESGDETPAVAGTPDIHIKHKKDDNQPSLVLLPSRRQLEDELALPPDMTLLLQRVNEIIAVLGNFSERREEGRSRSEYMEQLTRDLCNYFGYVPFLVKLFLKIFPPAECLEFLESNETLKPVTIRANTLKTSRKDLVTALQARGVQCQAIDKWSKVIPFVTPTMTLAFSPVIAGGHRRVRQQGADWRDAGLGTSSTTQAR